MRVAVFGTIYEVQAMGESTVYRVEHRKMLKWANCRCVALRSLLYAHGALRSEVHPGSTTGGLGPKAVGPPPSHPTEEVLRSNCQS